MLTHPQRSGCVVGLGRSGIAKRSSIEQICVMGQLGRVSADGFLQTSRSGHSICRESGRRWEQLPLPYGRAQENMGFGPLSWRALVEGARPEPVEPENLESGSVRRGWQHEAVSRVDTHFREHVPFDRLLPRDRSQVRSQVGPGWFGLTAVPASYHTKIPV